MSKDVISVDPHKIKAILKWHVPNNVTDIRSCHVPIPMILLVDNVSPTY